MIIEISFLYVASHIFSIDTTGGLLMILLMKRFVCALLTAYTLWLECKFTSYSANRCNNCIKKYKNAEIFPLLPSSVGQILRPKTAMGSGTWVM